jgi:hypothetical protein
VPAGSVVAVEYGGAVASGAAVVAMSSDPDESELQAATARAAPSAAVAMIAVVLRMPGTVRRVQRSDPSDEFSSGWSG